MKVVKQISTGRPVYRTEPEFKPGDGIPGASYLGIPETDLVEVEITSAEWDAEMVLRAQERKEVILNQPGVKEIMETIESLAPIIPALANFRAKVKTRMK